MTGASSETPVLDMLAAMTAESLARTGLDANSLVTARLAALVAVDAPAASYLMHVGAAVDAGVTAEQVQDILVAVAPIVGAPRTISAAEKITDALGVVVIALEGGSRPRKRVNRLNIEALWHDLECGGYGEDLPLWRTLAGEAPRHGAGRRCGHWSRRARPRRRWCGSGRAGRREGAAGSAGAPRRGAACRDGRGGCACIRPGPPILAGARADADAAAAWRTMRACGIPALRAGSSRARRVVGRGVGRRAGLLRRAA